MSDSNSNLKTCTVCNNPFPATDEYFHKQSSGLYGLRPDCKVCVNKRNREWRANNKEWMAEYNQQWREENKEYKQEKDRKYYEENKEQIKKQTLDYYYANHEDRLAKKREWYENNKKRAYEASRQWVIKNKQHVLEYSRAYRANNRKRTNRIKLIALHRRIARKRSLPDTFTTQEWEYCLEYFNYTCPVCDSQLRDLFGNVEPHADHWIPLAHPDCPGTVKENMVCLCNSCNMSKGAKLPKDWLLENYSKTKTETILSLVQDYFQSLS